MVCTRLLFRERLQIVSVAKEGLSPNFVPEKKSFWAKFPKAEVKKLIVVANCVAPAKKVAPPASSHKRFNTAPGNILEVSRAEELELSTQSTQLLHSIVGKVTASSPTSGQSAKAAPESSEEGAAKLAPDASTAPAKEQAPEVDTNDEPEPAVQPPPEPEKEEPANEEKSDKRFAYDSFFEANEAEFSASNKFALTGAGRPNFAAFGACI